MPAKIHRCKIRDGNGTLREEVEGASLLWKQSNFKHRHKFKIEGV
jgi:hypothetical protein